MQCRYCRAANQEDEHRCLRCGRRLHSASARPASEIQPIQTATAPDVMEYSNPAVAIMTAPEPERPRVVYQRALFRELQPIISIPSQPSEGRDTVKAHTPSRPRSGRKAHADQQALDFAGPRARTATEAVIYCDAPVASLAHRALAVALDSSMILISLGMFLIVFQFAGGVLVLNAHTAPILVGIAAVLGFLYQFLFCIAGGDTPGMRWTQLQLVDFDGQRPNRDQRVYRLGANCLSVLAAGLGLLWALVDEEKLTWHDHMSRTFPSPCDRDFVE